MSVISRFMASTRSEDMIVLDKIPYIHYSIRFWKGRKEFTKAQINLDSEINVIILAYAKELGLQIYCTNVGAQKLDS